MFKIRHSHNPKNRLPGRYVLILMTLLSAALIFLSLTMNLSGGPLNTLAGFIFTPMQNGINYVGQKIEQKTTELYTMDALKQENSELEEKVAELTEENNAMKTAQSELEEYRRLLQLKDQYTSFDMVGASVVAKDPGNWFSVFTIDKGSSDGIEKGMNVLCDGGLAGIVTDVGANYATVRTIVDEASNVSCMSTVTKDCFNVSGSLETMDQSMTIPFSQLRDSEKQVKTGDPVVTSYVSDEYHEGILVGYISTISEDANGLTRSGTITPAVDFEHIQNVMVVLKVKETGAEDSTEEEE